MSVLVVPVAELSVLDGAVLDGIVVVLGDVVLGDVVVLGVPGDVVVSVVVVVLGALELGVVVVVVVVDGDVDWSVVVVVLPDVCANAKPMAATVAARPAAMLRLFGNLLMNRFSCCRNDKFQSAKLSPPRHCALHARRESATQHLASAVRRRATALQHSSHIHARSVIAA